MTEAPPRPEPAAPSSIPYRWLVAFGLPLFMVLAVLGLTQWDDKDPAQAAQAAPKDPIEVDPAALFQNAAEADPPSEKAKDKDKEKDPEANRVKAPELDGGVAWLNSSGPIRMRDLRGKVVVLDFWTLCC